MTKRFATWPLYTLLAGFVVPTVGVFGYAYYEAKHLPPVDPTIPVVRDQEASALTEGLVSYLTDDTDASTATGTAPWSDLYPDTKPMSIGAVAVEASVADSWPERIQGLSNTPYLPPEVVKFFVFDSLAYHSIWMKDMKYPIDIMWVDEAGTIVHIAKNVPPESYPETFSPPTPALYVIEAVAGFASTHALTVGTSVTLPTL